MVNCRVLSVLDLVLRPCVFFEMEQTRLKIISQISKAEYGLPILYFIVHILILDCLPWYHNLQHRVKLKSKMNFAIPKHPEIISVLHFLKVPISAGHPTPRCLNSQNCFKLMSKSNLATLKTYNYIAILYFRTL